MSYVFSKADIHLPLCHIRMNTIAFMISSMLSMRFLIFVKTCCDSISFILRETLYCRVQRVRQPWSLPEQKHPLSFCRVRNVKNRQHTENKCLHYA